MTSIVIVGAGTAGFSCARELRKLDKQSTLTIVSADDADVYSKPMLSNALAKHMTATGLLTSTAEHMADTLSAKIINNTRVEQIDRENRQLRTAERVIDYDQLVLAVGAKQRDPGLDNPEQLPVHQINHIHDYSVFRQDLQSAKQVLILGAGFIGCEFANDLVGAGYSCSVVAPTRFPFSHLLPQPAGEYFMHVLAAGGVQWHMGVKGKALAKSGAGITLRLDDNSEVRGDLLLSAVGLSPNIELAQAAGLQTNRGIVVDEYLRSSDPDIFALGDCAEVNGQCLPFILPIMHGARALAATLSGNPSALHYPLMPLVVKTPACPLVMIAVPPNSVGDWEMRQTDAGFSAVFRDNSGRILGFALMGEAMAQRQAIMKQMTE